MTDNLNLAELSGILKNAFKVIDIQRLQIEAYTESVRQVTQQLTALHADTKITKIAVSVLLKEVSHGDKNELDRLLALSVARTEERSGELGETVRAAVLASIDELIILAESD